MVRLSFVAINVQTISQSKKTCVHFRNHCTAFRLEYNNNNNNNNNNNDINDYNNSGNNNNYNSDNKNNEV